MNWSSVMTTQLLTQRVARAAGKGWDCLFDGVHFALKGWLGRKLPAQVLVGLQAMGSGHLALALPTQGHLMLGLPDPYRGRPERHMVHGRACPCAGMTQALRWLQCAGQTQVPPGAWVLAKAWLAMAASMPRGARADPSVTWRLGRSNARGKPKRYLALGSRQRPDWLWQS
jgi:hypothetical protein